MDGLDLHGQILRLFKLQAPPQVQLVDFPFLDLGHPGQGLLVSRVRLTLVQVQSRALAWSAVPAMMDSILVVRCAIDMHPLSSLNFHLVGFPAWNPIYGQGCHS